MTEPHFDWQWCRQHDQLCLQTAQAVFRTPLGGEFLPASSAFTLGQAELYWQFFFALEVLHWPAEAVVAACIDAVAQTEFAVADAHKSFYLQSLHNHFNPAAGDIVQISGRNAALALVLTADDTQSRLMLLTELETLTGRTFAAGHSFSSLHDRLCPYQPAPQPWKKTA